MATIIENRCETANGVLLNLSEVSANVSKLYGEDVKAQTICEMVDNSTDIEYIDNEGNSVAEPMAQYKFIGLGICDDNPESSKQIYISLQRSNDGFAGFFVGSYTSLVTQIQRRFNSSSETEEVFNATLNELYDMLMDKEYWRQRDDVVSSLRQYLNATVCKCLEVEHTQYSIVRNEDNSRLCFNTRLVDKYGNFIYLSIKADEGFTRYSYPKIIVSKSDFIKAGFTGDRPGVVSYFTDLHDVVFQGSITEFDLEDTSKLDHMRQASRKQRLPKAYQNISDIDMSECIKTSVQEAMRRKLTDYSYFVPMYNISLKCIQFLIPLKLQREYSELAEVALIIGKDRRTGFYTVNTLIDVELAYINARAISSSVSSWLERAMAARRSDK